MKKKHQLRYHTNFLNFRDKQILHPAQKMAPGTHLNMKLFYKLYGLLITAPLRKKALLRFIRFY